MDVCSCSPARGTGTGKGREWVRRGREKRSKEGFFFR